MTSPSFCTGVSLGASALLWAKAHLPLASAELDLPAKSRLRVGNRATYRVGRSKNRKLEAPGEPLPAYPGKTTMV